MITGEKVALELAPQEVDRTEGPLRIALLTYRGNQFSGGQGVYVRHLSRELVNIGHRVTVISGPPYPIVDPGVELVRLHGIDLYSKIGVPGGGLFDVRGTLDFFEWLGGSAGFFPEPLTFGVRARRYLLDNQNFDIIHDNQSLAPSLLALRRIKTPVVATIHHPIHIDRDLSLARSKSWFETFRMRLWYSFLPFQEMVARRLALIIAVSRSSGVESQRAFGLDPARVRTVYNGVDTETFRPEPGVKRHSNRIIVVNSADTPIKGLDRLYGALSILLRDRDIEIKIVGRPMKPVRTERELARYGISGSVEFLGRLSEDALVRAYSEATVAVLPSVYEGFGFPVAEAMACGAPVVAYNAGALPEVIGDAGRIVAQGDQTALASAIKELLDDPDVARELGEAGRIRVTQLFRWEAAARQYAALYREAIMCSR